jgi:hypothetical protein
MSNFACNSPGQCDVQRFFADIRSSRAPASLAAEIQILRHQINILRRHSPKRQTFSAMDRLIFAGLYRLAPTALNALAIVKPETRYKAKLLKRLTNRPVKSCCLAENGTMPNKWHTWPNLGVGSSQFFTAESHEYF